MKRSRSLWLRIGWLIAVAAVLGVVPADAESLSLDGVIARHIEALGGLEKIRAIETVRKTGSYVYNGLEHPIVVVQVRGLGAREEIDGLTQWGTTTLAGKKTIRVSRGEQAWIRQETESEETKPIEGFELTAFLQDSQPESPLIDYESKGHAVELIGTETIDGTEAIHLRITFAGGEEQDWYLDGDSYLLLRRTRTLPENDYQSPRAWFYDDYREVAGVQMPFFIQLEENLFARDYLFDEIEVNVPVDRTLFKLE